MKMSKVLDCNATDCSYNRDKKCHTLAINVGDEEPICDTFFHTDKEAGYDDVIGGVGSCKVEDCMHNDSLECMSEGIHMKKVGSHVDCCSFATK